MSVWPVMYAGLRRGEEAHGPADVLGRSEAPMGMAESMRVRCSSLVSPRPGVSMLPGMTALTVTPRVATSTATERISPSIAAFDAP